MKQPHRTTTTQNRHMLERDKKRVQESDWETLRYTATVLV